MKKIILILLLLGIGYFFFIFNKPKEPTPENSKVVNPKKEEITVKSPIREKSLFVPYWSLNQGVLPEGYDRYIYFGITANKGGINKSEEGFKGIDKFITLVPTGKKKYLTLRLLDENVNNLILENSDLQNKIVLDTVNIIRTNKLDGFVLDLEITNYINPDITEQTNNFVHIFYTSLKEYYIPFSVTVYGDNFYRKRSFDISYFSNNSDGIMIMAYDFHKKWGEPGPNFPLSGRASYGYDFKTMIEDFSSIIPKNKISVIFGMFGYDWQVDEKKLPIKPVEALSLNEIRKKFLGKCIWQDCVVKRDEKSSETEVDYVTSEIKDDMGLLYYHIVWFDDEESVKAKTDYLMEQGISNIGYWANGYF